MTALAAICACLNPSPITRIGGIGASQNEPPNPIWWARRLCSSSQERLNEVAQDYFEDFPANTARYEP
jgi:hypothetical protein